MQLRQKQVIEALQRVQDFVNAHPVPPPVSYAGPKALLDAVVAQLTDHSANQMAGGRRARAETQRQRALKRQLRERHLRPIAKIATAVLREAPGIQVALRLPSRRLPITRLLAEAMAIRSSVSAYEPVFIANGRPADFLEQLDAAIDALRESLVGRARNVGLHVGAGLGLRQELQRGRSAIELLDAIVTTSFADDQDMLGKWRTARRIQDVPGGGPAPATPTTPATPATPATRTTPATPSGNSAEYGHPPKAA